MQERSIVACERDVHAGRCATCAVRLELALLHGGLRFCCASCVKQRRLLYRKVVHPGYPALSLRHFTSQTLFHPIDMSYPGLQLISVEPYIFIVRNFLSESDCAALIEKAEQSGAMDQQFVGESVASHRTSTGCVVRNEEVVGLRRRQRRLT